MAVLGDIERNEVWCITEAAALSTEKVVPVLNCRGLFECALSTRKLSYLAVVVREGLKKSLSSSFPWHAQSRLQQGMNTVNRQNIPILKTSEC